MPSYRNPSPPLSSFNKPTSPHSSQPSPSVFSTTSIPSQYSENMIPPQHATNLHPSPQFSNISTTFQPQFPTPPSAAEQNSILSQTVRLLAPASSHYQLTLSLSGSGFPSTNALSSMIQTRTQSTSSHSQPGTATKNASTCNSSPLHPFQIEVLDQKSSTTSSSTNCSLPVKQYSTIPPPYHSVLACQ